MIKTKKFWVLFSLFVLPLVFYIFLSKGIYKYSNLPILTENVQDIAAPNTFKKNLNVVGFFGSDIETAKAAIFNLNQTIYKRYYQKPLFQMVAIIPETSEQDYEEVLIELSSFTDIKKWKFIYAKENEIKQLFSSFNSPFQLNNNLHSPYAFIIDMELRLRGRKDDEDITDGKLYGYNMRSVSELKNKMKDDINIIYYQLKKSAEKQARRKRKI
jgi:hypothetical protein